MSGAPAVQRTYIVGHPLKGAAWILTVAFYGLVADEAYTHDSAVGTVVAGYLAREDHWPPFMRAAKLAHERARLQTLFHMTDFMTPDHADYAHLTPSEKKRLISSLVGAIGNTRKVGFVAAVYRQAFKDEVPLGLRKRIKNDPYIFCVQTFTKIVASWAPSALSPGDKIVFAFERQKRSMDDWVRAAYWEIANPDNRHEGHEFLASDCMIQEKKESGELIAADILANCAGRFMKRPRLSMAKRDDPVLWRLLTNRQLEHRWKYFDAERLREIADRLTTAAL